MLALLALLAGLELLAALLAVLLATLLTGLPVGRQELPRLRVARLLLCLLALLLPELLGVAPVGGALVGAPTLLTGEARLLAGRLLLGGDVPLLLLTLGHLLLAHLALLARLSLLERLLALAPAELLLWLLPELLLLGLLLGLLALLGPLAALLTARGQELAGLRVTRALLGDLAHPLAELGRVALVGGALVGAAALLAGEARLLAGRLLLGRDVPLLLLGLLAHLSLLLLTILSLPWILLTHS